jgi:hypothetical protein
MAGRAVWRAAVPECDRVTALWLLTVVALAALTLLTFARLGRYEITPSSLPEDPGFATISDGTAPARNGAGAIPGWEVEGDRNQITVRDGTLHLRNDDPSAGVGVRQVWRLPTEGARAFRVTATVASENIRGTRRGFRVGEVTLTSDRDIERRYFLSHHRLAGLRGTRPEGRYREIFEFPRATREIELAIRLRHATGELRVSDLRITALRERPAFAALRVALQVGWVLLLGCGCWLFWRGVDHRRSGYLLALAAAAGTALLLMPQGMRNAAITTVSELMPRVLVVGDRVAYIGHFLVFALAGGLVRLSRRGDRWPGQLALLVGLAGLLELLQYLSELRAPTLDDWLANALGAIAGWAVAALALWRRQEGQLATQR